MSFLTLPWHLGLSLVVGDKDPHCEGARAETVQCDNHVAIMLGGPVITRKAGKVLFKVKGDLATPGSHFWQISRVGAVTRGDIRITTA